MSDISVNITVPARNVRLAISGQPRRIGCVVTAQATEIETGIVEQTKNISTSVNIQPRRISAVIEKRACPHTLYPGEQYVFTPTAYTQVIECENRVMLDDIRINPVPSYYGLITYNGRTITVS